MERFDPKIIKKLVEDIAMKVSVPQVDAAIFAESLVENDICGVSTHGVSRLDIYIRRIQKGLISPDAKLTIDRCGSALFTLDAGNGLGQVQAFKALRYLIAAAKEKGVAAATIRNSQHFGTLSYYCNKAADEGMILLATTSSEPAMPPYGGYEAFFGTNPLAVSFPTGKGFHIKVDLATSKVARGNIIAAQKSGATIPDNWALDPGGNPTNDPVKALAGTVLTMAEHKGYALALMVEVFSSVLSGAAIGPDIGSMYKNMDRKQNVGHFFCLFDIGAFMDFDHYLARIDATIDRIKSGASRPGVEEILIPGERSYRKAQVNRARGMTIDAATLKELKILCDELNISNPF